MLETRLFLTKDYLNIKSWEICFNQAWQTNRALKDTSFVGTVWGEKGVSADAPIMEELCEPGISGHTGRGAHLCITNLQETGLFQSECLSNTCKWDADKACKMYGVLLKKYYPYAHLITQEEIHSCPSGQHRRPLGCTQGVETSMTITYTRRGQQQQVSTFHISTDLGLSQSLSSTSAFFVSGTFVGLEQQCVVFSTPMNSVFCQVQI